MKALKCRHKGCKKKHKSSTGFCSEHASDMDRHVVRARETQDIPHLEEERWENPYWRTSC